MISAGTGPGYTPERVEGEVDSDAPAPLAGPGARRIVSRQSTTTDAPGPPLALLTRMLDGAQPLATNQFRTQVLAHTAPDGFNLGNCPYLDRLVHLLRDQQAGRATVEETLFQVTVLSPTERAEAAGASLVTSLLGRLPAGEAPRIRSALTSPAAVNYGRELNPSGSPRITAFLEAITRAGGDHRGLPPLRSQRPRRTDHQRALPVLARPCAAERDRDAHPRHLHGPGPLVRLFRARPRLPGGLHGRGRRGDDARAAARRIARALLRGPARIHRPLPRRLRRARPGGAQRGARDPPRRPRTVQRAIPLSSPPDRERANKILWVSRDPVAGISDLGSPHPRAGRETAVQRKVAGGPGLSIIDLPHPGCRQLSRERSGQKDRLRLAYGAPDRRSSNK